MRILVITAVAAEQESFLRGIKADSRFDVIAGGVGPVMAAISTTKALLKKNYDLVISAGIGGGFLGVADVGTVVLATEIIAADLGVQTTEGFASIEELGFGISRISVDQDMVSRLTKELQLAGLKATSGPIATLSTVTGSASTAQALASRIPSVAVEAMEGFGVGLAAKEAGISVIEIRTISNPVGPRDKSSWKIKEALLQLEKTSSVLREVLTS